MNMRPSIILLVGIAITAVFLGTLGFHQLGSENGWAVSPNWLTSFYLAVQLFTLNSGGVQGPIPLLLEAARWLAPIATLGGFFALASTYIARFHDWVRFTFLIGEHTIFCGVGEKGSTIAFDQLDCTEGKKGVVVIESDPDVPSLQSLRQSGALVVIGDARSPEVLASAGLDRASGLVAVAGTDECNLAIALVTAKTVSLERSSDPLSVFT